MYQSRNASTKSSRQQGFSPCCLLFLSNFTNLPTAPAAPRDFDIASTLRHDALISSHPPGLLWKRFRRICKKIFSRTYTLYLTNPKIDPAHSQLFTDLISVFNVYAKLETISHFILHSLYYYNLRSILL